MPCSSPAAARPDSMGRAGLLVLSLFTAGVAGVVQGCSDTTADVPWTATIDTVTLYSLAVPDLTRASAYDFTGRTRVRIEQPGSQRAWDLALDTRGGALVLVPPGALGIDSKARIAALPGQSFSQVQKAPSDTLLYASNTTLPVDLNTTYVVRTDQRASPIGIACEYYAKMQPIALDAAAGSMRFIYDVSPVCNDLRLVPPDSIK